MKSKIEGIVWAIFLALAAWIIFFNLAHCETKPFVQGEVGVLNRLGYTGPTFGIGGGLRLDSRSFSFEALGSVSSAHKLETKDGHSLKLDSSICFGRSLQAGIGTRWTRLTTSQYTKAALRPYPTVALRRSAWNLQGRYLLPMFDTQNGLAGPEVSLELFQGKWSAELTGGALRFHDTRVPGVDYGGIPALYHWGSETSIGLRRYF